MAETSWFGKIVDAILTKSTKYKAMQKNVQELNEDVVVLTTDAIRSSEVLTMLYQTINDQQVAITDLYNINSILIKALKGSAESSSSNLELKSDTTAKKSTKSN